MEIIDAEGNQVNFGGGGSSHGTAFGVRDDAELGVLTVRIVNTKYGHGQFSEPFSFTDTNDPLPPELIAAYVRPVAPGQWIDLQTSSAAQLKHSERTDVAFKQSGRTIIVATTKPFGPHVQVPSVFSAGEVQLQARTWRDGRPSQWSEPIVISLAEKPVPPSVNAIRLDRGNWVQLWPGPDRPTSFSVTPGDAIVINGQWPVADASKLKVALVRPGEVVTLSVDKVDKTSGWFIDVRMRLPKRLEVGDWRMIVSSETDGTQCEVPLVIRVEVSTTSR